MASSVTFRMLLRYEQSGVDVGIHQRERYDRNIEAKALNYASEDDRPGRRMVGRKFLLGLSQRFNAITQVVLDALNMDSAKLIIDENREKFILGRISCGPFTRSWRLQGFENALVDSILNADFYEELLERIMEMHLVLVDRLCTLPIDGVLFTDDWGDQRGVILGPDRWRRFIKPRIKNLYKRAHDAGKLVLTHCCGNVFDIIPDMIEAGLDVLESLQPEAMDVYEIKRRYGRDLRLWGGLGMQQLLAFGTPDDVRKEIRRLIAEMGRGGGYILAPAKILMEDVPTENAVALIEEFAQNG